ncbi:PleD family two-component system response regulator [Algibacter sp. L4_22]|nr:response regulator [Algibacter sp. L4_22]MCL5128179.1 response regulator [Algibacter sp. L4_22]
MKILAIDDDQLVLLPLSKRLEELGYKVCTTTNPKKGTELFGSFKPDLIIVDINMPKFSGLEYIRYVRKIKNSSIPIIVLSGNTSIEVMSEGFKLGISDYIKKPISLSEICNRIKRINIYFRTH